MDKLKDKKILDKLNQGDEEAFLEVYDFYAPKIFRYIYYQIGKNKELTEDLAQQTFFKAWHYIQTKNTEIENIQAFLYRVARNLVVDLWRGKEKESLPLLDELVETTDELPRWQEIIEARVDVVLLEKSLDNINEQYRNVLVMRYLQEMEIQEIAEVLEKDKDNIYVLIHRALKALRRCFETEELKNERT